MGGSVELGRWVRVAVLVAGTVVPIAADPVWARLAEVIILGGGTGLLGYGLVRICQAARANPRPITVR